MKHHYEMIIAVAFCALSLSAQTNVVYEPLIVDSGFNRDVIAEATPVSSHAWSPMYDLTSGDAHRSCAATKEVMVAVNQASSQNFSENDMLITERCGWPNDYRDTIRCEENANINPEYANVKFLLAPYDEENALCLRPDEGFQKSGTLHFKKIGCYNKLFFLMISMQVGGNKDNRRVDVRLYYTNGDIKDTTFNFVGLSGEDGKKFHLTNIYEYGDFRKNTGSQTKAFACIYDIAIADSLLVDSIWFQNPKPSSAVEILAVTGRTADIAAPDEESTEVKEIDLNSFQACWDAVAEAASYRLDVATDPDFQNILAEYNNKIISGESTCQEVIDLVSNNDYYWRVRSVNSDGGQSASSAPRRVKTAPDPEKGDTPPTIGETDDDITTELAEYANAKATMATYRINRTLYRDGYFNTICLPFSLDEAGIAASPLTGCKLFAFESATKAAVGLDLVITPVTTIEAGVPYLIKWEDMGDIIPKPLEFHNVNIVTSTGLEIGEGDVHFVGHIAQAHIPCEIQDNLFVGENNTLYWPDETDSKMKGFRAYFAIQTSSPSGAPIKRGTPARLVERKNTPTDIITVSGDRLAVSGKMLINGQLVIIRDGKYYNVLGGRIQ